MKPITDLLTNPQALSSESRTPPPEPDMGPVMYRLWLRMTEIFGHKWTSSYSDQPTESWCRVLQGITPQQIAHGLNAMMGRDDAWPPTAIEFRNLCLNPGGVDTWQTRCHRIAEHKGLEDLTAKEERIHHGLAQLKKLRAEVGL